MTLTLVKPNPVHLPTITTLSNGLTIIAEQLPVSAVSLNVWFNVGSKIETNNINGMAHFLEHMIFKGSAKLACGEFERLIEQRGAVTNAATSQEYTHFYLTCSPKDFADLAPLQLDLVLHPQLPETEFESERLVVLEEIRRSQDNPKRKAYNQAMEICFPNLPLHRPILGTSEIIEKLTCQQMRNFHQQWYQPTNMTVAVAGDLPVENLTEIIANQVENSPFNCLPKETNFLPELPFQEIISAEYIDTNLQQARLIMLWRVPGLNSFQETITLDVLAVILGQGKLSRLFRDLRETRHLVTKISSHNMTYKVQGAFYISAQLAVEKLAEVETEIIKHLQHIQEFGITESELNRVCLQVANHFIFQGEKPSDRTNLYGYYYSQLQDLTPALEYAEKIRNLTVKDIQIAAEKYLSTKAYGIVKAKNY